VTSPGARDPAKQGWRTPPEFIAAVERRFGPIGFDLAATDGHEVCPDYFSPADDSLAQNWGDIFPLRHGATTWLNPPYANIRPWVAKLDAECRDLSRWTLCLVPASMGSKWWADHVLNKCFALGVTRMAFCDAAGVPSQLYPKDLALLCYGYGVSGHGFWDWKAAP
jgi:phage N-6-adenine-methyltransferase